MILPVTLPVVCDVIDSDPSSRPSTGLSISSIASDALSERRVNAALISSVLLFQFFLCSYGLTQTLSLPSNKVIELVFFLTSLNLFAGAQINKQWKPQQISVNELCVGLFQ